MMLYPRRYNSSHHDISVNISLYKGSYLLQLKSFPKENAETVQRNLIENSLIYLYWCNGIISGVGILVIILPIVQAIRLLRIIKICLASLVAYKQCSHITSALKPLALKKW
jgi:hypothetical protein